jgi:hypothetical protein
MLKTAAQTHSNKTRDVSPLGLNRSAKALNRWLGSAYRIHETPTHSATQKNTKQLSKMMKIEVEGTAEGTSPTMTYDTRI